MRIHAVVAAGFAAVLAVAPFATADDLPKDAVSHLKTLPQWIKDLHSYDPSVVETALQNIANYGKNADEAIKSTLWHLENNRDVGVRANAAYTLGVIGVNDQFRKDAVNTLARLGRYDLPNVRYQCILALSRLGKDARDAVKELTLALTDRSATWEIRKVAAIALGNVAGGKGEPPDASVIEALTRNSFGINDAVNDVRLESLHALIALGPPPNAQDQAAAVKALDNVLKDKKNAKIYPVVIWTHVALMRLDKVTDAHMKALTDQLKSADAAVRVEAARALYLMATATLTRVPELIEALGAANQPHEVADALALALSASKDKVNAAQVQTIAGILKDADPNVRCHGALGLAVLGTQAKAVTPEVINALRDADASVAKSAITTLTSIADPPGPAIAALKQLAADAKDPSIQAAAILGADSLAHRPNKVAQQAQPKPGP